METVYILQIITICLTAFSLFINVLITLKTNKQENYNNIITKSRLDFMNQDRINAAQFIAEAKNIATLVNCKKAAIDLKPLFYSFAQINIALKPYNEMERKILDVGQSIVDSAEKSVIDKHLDETYLARIDEFTQLINIYDDADWKFIKQQFNSSNKNSEDFDRICDYVMSKYK